ncbi:MAG: N-acetylmuramoyl-L-alanine amidase [Pseudorhodoplanes sp.]
MPDAARPRRRAAAASRLGTVAALIAVLLLQPDPGAGAQTVPRAAPRCDRAAFKVVVDVGHTAEVPGAISARGISEYEFNLRLARELVQQLTAAGFAATTLLVTEGEVARGLVQRVSRANRAGANLFLSIHHDAVPEHFLEDWEFEGQPYRFSDRFKGHSLFVSYDNPQSRASLAFARLLGQQLKNRGLQYTPHYTEPFMGSRRRELLDKNAGVYRYDRLHVLRGTHMPAVLLEAGVIKNREEELLLAAPEHRALLVAAAVEAIESFCAQRAPVRTAPARAARP